MAVKLTVNDVSFSYGDIRVLDGITMEINDGELVSLIGPNGAGKSTLLKCINRILKPKSGAILLNGQDMIKTSSRELSKMMGYVPQSNVDVFPFAVYDIVLMGRKPHIGWRVGKKDIEIVAQALEVMGIGDLGTRYFDELSGGEKQKVVMARALAQEPKVLLLDEPTSNLDIMHQLEVMEIIWKLIHDKGISAIMAMHDLNLASRFSDRMIMIKNCRVFTSGTPELVLNQSNIREVYGVETQITKTEGNKPYVVPISPA